MNNQKQVKEPENKSSINELTKIRFDLLVANYNVFAERTKLFFTNLYSIINFTIVFYGGMLVLLNAFTEHGNEEKRITFILIVFYAIPVITYILGLFYGYNSLHLYRLGEEEIRIENEMKKLAKKNGFEFAFSEWEQKTKNETHSPGFILPYGTMLMFYMLVPIGIIIVFNVLFSWPQDNLFLLMQVIIPALLWIIYFVFMLILIRNMFRARKRINKGE